MRWFPLNFKPVLLATLVISLVGSLAFCLLAWWIPNQWLAKRLHLQMQSADEAELNLYSQQLAALGNEGWRVLLTDLHSDRPEVILAARRALLDAVRSWHQQPSDVSARNAAGLARLAAEHVKSAKKSELPFYGDLAERLLDWPASGEATNRVYDCEQVIRAAREGGWPSRMVDTAPQPPKDVIRKDPDITHLGDAMDSGDGSETASTETTEPSTPVSIKSVPDVVVDSESKIGPSAEPMRKHYSLSDEPRPLGSSNPDAAEQAAPDTTVSAEPDWMQMKIAEVVRALREPKLAAAAEAELQRRKFDPLNLRIAQAAADSNYENRIKLVRMLPDLSGVDVAGWLLLLAQDESPRVRIAAVQLLATTRSPQIHRRLEELEQTEMDDEVRTALRTAQTTPQ